MPPDAAANAAPARPGEPVAEDPAPATGAPAAGESSTVRRPPLPERPAVRRPDDVGSEPGGPDGSPRPRVR